MERYLRVYLYLLFIPYSLFCCVFMSDTTLSLPRLVRMKNKNDGDVLFIRKFIVACFQPARVIFKTIAARSTSASTTTLKTFFDVGTKPRDFRRCCISFNFSELPRKRTTTVVLFFHLPCLHPRDCFGTCSLNHTMIKAPRDYKWQSKVSCTQ